MATAPYLTASFLWCSKNEMPCSTSRANLSVFNSLRVILDTKTSGCNGSSILALDLNPGDPPVDHAGIGRLLVRREPREVGARFIEEGGREDVAIGGGNGAGERREIDIAHGAASAGSIGAEGIEVREIGTDGDGVVVGRVEIQAGVVLVAAGGSGHGDLDELQIGDAVQPTADAVGVGVCSRLSLDRADIEPAGHLMAGSSAEAAGTGRIEDVDDPGRDPGRLENLGRYATRPRADDGLAILGRFGPHAADAAGLLAKPFVGEEPEKLAAFDRPAEAAAELTVQVIVTDRQGATRPAPLIVGIQAGGVVLEEAAAVDVDRKSTR